MRARIGLKLARQFDAATPSRRTRNWSRPLDRRRRRKLARSRSPARQRHDLVRNNKYAEAGVRHLVADMIGDGIAPQFTHAEPAVAAEGAGRMEALGRKQGRRP
jgi:hypothetical protein